MNAICFTAVNCRWSRYGPWTACSATCGGGFQRRRRVVRKEAENGGKPCTGENLETRSCNTDPCTGTHSITLLKNMKVN